MKLIPFLFLTIYSSCLVPDPKTHIVVASEQGGCTDADHSSLSSLQTCFHAHELLARQLAPECQYQVAHTNSAHWGDTTEGRICRVVIPVAAHSILVQFQAIN